MNYMACMISLTLAVGLLAGGCVGLEPSASDGEVSSDAQVAQAIRQQLAADAVMGASYISVSVRAGTVTLDGSVPDAGARLRAVGIARTTPGVEKVVDQLRSW